MEGRNAALVSNIRKPDNVHSYNCAIVVLKYILERSSTSLSVIATEHHRDVYRRRFYYILINTKLYKVLKKILKVTYTILTTLKLSLC